MNKDLPSIRTRLAHALVGWSVLWSVAVSMAVWLAVQNEVDELLDDTLEAAAEVLSGPLSIQAQAESPPAGHDAGSEHASSLPSGRFAWQVVRYPASGKAQVLIKSPAAPTSALRGSPSPAFGDASGWRVFGISLADGSEWLYVAQSHEERHEAQLEVAFGAALATLAIALIAHLWLRARVRHELLPLQRLAQHLGAHDPASTGATLGKAERQELQPVHAAIDALAERLARRLAQERAFTSHAAHALRTPLAGIDAQLAVALRECPPELQPRLQRVRTAAGRLQRVVAALLTLFRSGAELQRQPLDLTALISRLPLDALTIDVQAPQAVSADADLLAAALLNLFDNSLRNGATRVQVSTPTATTVRLDDNGPGVSPERRRELQSAIAAQAYEGSTGLGLVLADLVARAHDGVLLIPDVSGGFAIELRLGPCGE